MTTMTLKTARRIEHFAKALPILKPRMRAKVARAARVWLARGYEPTTNLPRPGAEAISWSHVRTSLIRLAVADLGAFTLAKVNRNGSAQVA